MTDVEEPTADESQASGTARHPLVARLVAIGRIVVSLAVVLAIAYAAASEWSAVSRTISDLSWQALVIAVTSIVLGMFATVRAWQHLLRALGTELSYVGAVQVNMVGQLGKYLPGSVWSFVLQAELGRRYRLPRSRAIVTLLLSAGLTIATALTLSVFAISSLLGTWGSAAWLLLVGPLSLVIAIPRVMARIANTVLRVMRRPALDRPIVGREVLAAVGWSVVSWLLFGAQLWALTSSLGLVDFRGYLLVLGAFALAMSAGFVAFVLPSGVGVREAVIVAGLSPLLSSGPALAIALASRLLFTVADVACALLATAAAKFIRT